MKNLILCLALTGIFSSHSFAEARDSQFSDWPTDLKINGTIIACSPGEIDPDIPKAFLASAGEAEAKTVVVDFDSKLDAELIKSFLDGSKESKTFSTAETPIDKQALHRSLTSATGVLLLSANPLEKPAAELLASCEKLLKSRVTNGAVVCAIGPVASYLGNDLKDSLGMIPDSLIRTGYLDDKNRDQILSSLGDNSHNVGIGIQNDTAIVLNGRKIRVFGIGTATFMLAANDRAPARVEQIYPRSPRHRSPYETVADLTAWRRDAIERKLPPFPTEKPPIPHVEKGTLIIVGGGGMPSGLMARMVKLAGGKRAKMVYVPCTEDEVVSPESGPIRQWKAMGVESAVVIHTKDRIKANTDEEFLAPLKDATGIWFGGGRQWNFADSYYGTKAHRLMLAVVERGGVIGGSSAGASIQGDYLARANPVANFDIMAPGYERGLGFLTGVAIDQHFSQRKRQKDMTQLVARYPQLLGIGIDEATALIVNRSQAEIVGRGKVYFYDRSHPTPEGSPDYQAFGEGSTFDLARRKPLVEKQPKSGAADSD